MKTSFVTLAFLLASGALISDGIKPYCAETVIEVDIDHITELGFSGGDLLNLANVERSLDWSWEYKEGTTTLTLFAQSAAQTARFIDSVAVYPDGAIEIGIICPDRVEVDAWVTFVTEDGAFDERFYVQLYDTDGTDCRTETGDLCLTPGHEAKFATTFGHQTLNGNFYHEVLVPEDWTIDFYVEGKFKADGAQSNVYGQAFTCEDDICNSYYVHGGRTPEGTGPIH